MKKVQARWVLAFALVSAAPYHARAEEPLLVQAVIGPDTSMSDTVRRECALDIQVGDWVLESVSKKHPGSKKLREGESAGDGKLLKVTIVSVIGAGGGAYSGPKTMAVRADLMQAGKVIATTRKERSSGGGAFGGMKGTCQIFGRVAKTLGSDVAGWLPSAMKGN